MTNWDDAKRCPTCKANGDVTSKRPAPSGDGQLLTLYCTDRNCKDVTIPWYVQVRSDGTIPEATTHTKQTTLIDGRMNNPALAQQIRDALQAQHDMTMKPGGAEITYEGR